MSIATHLAAAVLGAACLHYGPAIVAKVKPESRKNMELAQRMKLRLVNNLKDPDSLKLANTFLARGDGKDSQPALCGEANAKNSMGGYVGFRQFVVTEDMGPWFDDSDDKTKQLAFVNTQLAWCVNRIADIQFPER
jgi:hypothetical protein